MEQQRTELEKFYKGLRKDLGLNEIENPEVIKAQNIAAEEASGEEDGLRAAYQTYRATQDD